MLTGVQSFLWSLDSFLRMIMIMAYLKGDGNCEERTGSLN